MWKKVFLLVVVVGMTLAHPTSTTTTDDESSSSTEVEESITTTLRTTMTGGTDETLSGNYSDSVVVEAVVGDESGESGSETDEAKEFDPNDCFLEKERGPCRAVIDSWFYNKETRTCEAFAWSGCGGNNNRFPEDKKCHQVCNNVTLDGLTPPSSSSAPVSTSESSTITTTTTTTTTTVPSIIAKISAAIKKASCPKFEGCATKGCIVVQEASTHGCKICQCSESDGGTVKITRSAGTLSSEVNKTPVIGSVSGQPMKLNGTTVEEDEEENSKEASSTDKPEDVCQLPEVRGNCRAMMTRYRWDGTKCVLFHFGGCDGNANNFVTEKKCLDVCGKPK